MKLLYGIIDTLGLTKPVYVTVKTKRGKHWEASYSPRYNQKGKLAYHKIVILATDSERGFDTLLAHELIHAKQEELGLTEIHGKVFRKWARKLEQHYPELQDIFLQDVDK